MLGKSRLQPAAAAVAEKAILPDRTVAGNEAATRQNDNVSAVETSGIGIPANPTLGCNCLPIMLS